MSKYLLSLFVRFLVAFSGFIVVVVTSKLYGPEGRGLIGFGTSLVSIVGAVLSLNLGRSFLVQWKKSPDQKLLPKFLSVHCLLMILGVVVVSLLWVAIDDVRSILKSPAIFAFLMLIPNYLWSVNAISIYAALNLTYKHDVIVLISRSFLIFGMCFIYLLDDSNINIFLFLYAFILLSSTFFEMRFLWGSPLSFFKVFNISKYVLDSTFVHLDYIAFNSFPLLLMLISGGLMELADLGRLNFIFQLISLVYIPSFVASIRIKSYVGHKGAYSHLLNIKKLLIFTSLTSVSMSIVIFNILASDTFLKFFPAFGDLSPYFLMISLSIPGYLAYQFLYPVLLEYDLIEISMKINMSILLLHIFASYFVIFHFGLFGVSVLFAAFYLFIMLSQFYLFSRLRSLLT